MTASALDSWKVLRRVLLVLAFVLLALFLFGLQLVRTIQHDPDLHVVEVVVVTDEVLVRAMRDLYVGEMNDDAPLARFEKRMQNLLLAHTSPGRIDIDAVRDSLVERYEQEIE